MPTDKDKELDMGYVLRLEPKQAVDYLKSKGYNITWDWHEMLNDAHARAFTVAKATRAEVLDTIRWATEKAISEGQSERDFIKNLEPKLKELGWWGKVVDEDGNTVQLGSVRRLKTIFRTNKSTAYHAGRYMEQMANSDEQPYWQYVAVKDSRTRVSHLALDGKVYRFDDPIWNTMYPPNDWGCRCRVRALSEFRLKKNGLSVSESGEIKTESAVAGVNKDTGEEIRTEVSKIKTDQGEMKVGAGWNYNVGSAAVGTDVALIRKITQLKNRELRQQTITAINNSEERHKAFEYWVKAHLGQRGAGGRYTSAGFVTTEIAEKVTALSEGKKMSELVLVMTERRLEHANSLKHHQGNISLTIEEYASISRIIANPKAVLWDKRQRHNNLIYLNSDLSIQVIVDAPNKDKVKPNEKVDSIINAYKINLEEIKKGIRGGELILIQGSL